MRAAGCIINDIADKNFDAKVERTKNRPLASGEVKLFEAIGILLLLLLVGAGVLFFLPNISVYIALGIMPLVVAYPFMKRITYWPQLFLGIVFNIGVLVAYTTITENIFSLSAILLYAACIFWTLGYDTIYAHQDIVDDLQIGVKSTAIKFGKKTRLFVGVFYLAFVLLAMLASIISSTPTPFGFIMLGLLTAHLAYQVIILDTSNPALCGKLFKANVVSGGLMLLVLLG